MEKEVSKLKIIFILIISVSLFTGVSHSRGDTLFDFDSLYLAGDYDYLIDSLETNTYQNRIVKARTSVKVGFFERAEKILDECDNASVEKAILYYRMGAYSKATRTIERLKPANGFQADLVAYLKFKLKIDNESIDLDDINENSLLFNSLASLEIARRWYDRVEDKRTGAIDSALSYLSRVEYSTLNNLDKPTYHFLKCKIYNNQGEYEVALNHFDDLLKANYIFDKADEIISFAEDSLAPNLDRQQTLRLVNSLKRKRYFDQAVVILANVDSNDTTRLETAWAYFGEKQYTRAAAIFDSLASSVDSAIIAEALYGLAVCDYRRGRRLDGVGKLLEFAESYPTNILAPRALFTAGDFYMRSDRSRSLDIFSKLIDSYPESRHYPRVLYLAGSMYSKSGKNDQAVEMFAKYPYDNDTADLFEYWRFKLAPQDSTLLKNVIDRKYPSFYNYKSREKLGYDKPDTVITYDEFLSGFLAKAEKYLGWRVKRHVFDRGQVDLVDSLFKYGLEYEAGLQLVNIHGKTKNYYRDIELIRKAYDLKLEWAYFEILEDFKESLQKLGYSFSFHTWDRLKYPFLYRALVRFHAKDRTDPYLALSVIRRESRFDPLAVSNVGALGLMQLMPATAAQMARMDEVPVAWMFEPGYNILLGCKYLRWLDVRLKKDEIVVAAYNAGPTAAKRWKRMAGIDTETYIETIGYDQSRNYTRWVIGDYYWYRFLWPKTVNE